MKGKWAVVDVHGETTTITHKPDVKEVDGAIEVIFTPGIKLTLAPDTCMLIANRWQQWRGKTYHA